MKILNKFRNSSRVTLLARNMQTAAERIGWASVVATLSASNAFAQAGSTGTDPSEILNNICDFILGPFGQSLAILGIIAIGVSWMFGRASLGLIAGVIGGIVIMFGASFIGSTLTGS